NATGKSTVGKVLAVCRYFSYIVPTNSIDEEHRNYFENGLQEWGLSEFVRKDTFIRYQCEDYIIEIKKREVKIENPPDIFGHVTKLLDYRFYPEFRLTSPRLQGLLDSLEKAKTFQE